MKNSIILKDAQKNEERFYVKIYSNLDYNSHVNLSNKLWQFQKANMTGRRKKYGYLASKIQLHFNRLGRLRGLFSKVERKVYNIIIVIHSDDDALFDELKSIINNFIGHEVLKNYK